MTNKMLIFLAHSALTWTFILDLYRVVDFEFLSIFRKTFLTRATLSKMRVLRSAIGSLLLKVLAYTFLQWSTKWVVGRRYIKEGVKGVDSCDFGRCAKKKLGQKSWDPLSSKAIPNSVHKMTGSFNQFDHSSKGWNFTSRPNFSRFERRFETHIEFWYLITVVKRHFRLQLFEIFEPMAFERSLTTFVVNVDFCVINNFEHGPRKS